MKKVLPYIIAIVVILVAGILIVSTRRNAPRRFVERVTLRQADRIPYGTAVARNLLPTVFPNSSVFFDTRMPTQWDSILISSYNQAVVLVTIDFNASEAELQSLLYFARQGNYVFIIARNYSDEVRKFFNFSIDAHAFDEYLGLKTDSLKLRLEKKYFESGDLFVYPGKKFETVITELDTARTLVLGRTAQGQPNFVQFNAGSGRIFVHTAPLAFSNYFILHKDNARYFEQAMSVIPPKVSRVLWNEYYLEGQPSNQREEAQPNMFRVFMRYDAFRWGLLTGLFLLALYLLLASRRRQRKIPFYTKPRNDSLDFVRTIGRLYHDQRDHQNLARKMSLYFLEHVRTQYKLSTASLDEQFTATLQFKSGYDREQLAAIISFINYLEENPPVSEQDLYRFHRQLELFYKNT